jgi:hypothetical protein
LCGPQVCLQRAACLTCLIYSLWFVFCCVWHTADPILYVQWGLLHLKMNVMLFRLIDSTSLSEWLTVTVLRVGEWTYLFCPEDRSRRFDWNISKIPKTSDIPEDISLHKTLAWQPAIAGFWFVSTVQFSNQFC